MGAARRHWPNGMEMKEDAGLGRCFSPCELEIPKQMPWAAQFLDRIAHIFSTSSNYDPSVNSLDLVFFPFLFLFALHRKRGKLFSQILNTINGGFTISLIALLLWICHEVICLCQVWGKAKTRLFQNKISNKEFLQLQTRFPYPSSQTICFLLWLSWDVFSYPIFFFLFARSKKNFMAISTEENLWIEERKQINYQTLGSLCTTNHETISREWSAKMWFTY